MIPKNFECPKCQHQWTQRTQQPKRCPQCQRRFYIASPIQIKESKPSPIIDIEKKGRVNLE